MARVRAYVGAALLAAGGLLMQAVSAQMLDDIDVRVDQGIAQIRLQFTAPVRYIRHFPVDQGELVKLYLQVLSLEDFELIDLQEYKRTPKSTAVPPFTVMYTTVRNCLAVPNPLCLDIQFSQPVRFRVRQGEDSRSILLDILPPAGGAPSSKRR